MPSERRLKAIHEAGHAVIARKLGVVVQHVRMTQDQAQQTDASVWQESAAWKNPGDKLAIETNIKVSLAGMWAQDHAYPGSVAEEAADDTRFAMSGAVKIAFINASLAPQTATGRVTVSAAMRAEIEATLRRLNRETKDLVAKHWPQIRRVATTLMSKDTVIGSELDELINRKTR
jgi:hypothetical protein